jgi:serine/threonine protein kinase
MSLIEQTIRGYTFQKQIGKGGFGEVYLAWQEAIERTVAIKIILPIYANKPEFQERFEIEARLVARLEHPHIIPLYDYWQDDSGAYLVMRHAPEGTLEDILKKEESLSWSQSRRILLQILEALEVAHDNNVIHRDIKPANILLDDRGNAYLTDFGIAWMAGSASHEQGVVGTIAYLAPELFRGDPPSPQGDLYALGIVLYQMLSGVLPFSGKIPQIIAGHLTQPMPSILDLKSDLPAMVEVLILRLTMKDPEDRYASVNEILAELENTPIPQSQPSKATVSMLAKGQGLRQLSRQQGNTLELRNRFSMIDTVYAYWIEGVLENLLSGYALLDIDLHLEPTYVNTTSISLNNLEDEQTQAIADSAESILQLFEAYNGKLLILGEAGVGKSTLLLTLARDLLQQASEDEEFPIPVVFNLSSWVGKMPLSDWMEHELNEKYQVPRSVASRWLQNDSLLLLLDGLDEVNKAHRQDCLEEINAWREEHSFVDVVVSSRVSDYETLSDKLHLNGAVIIQPLADKQVTNYLDQVGSQTMGLLSLLNDNPEMQELSHSPLMLSVMITAYQDVTTEQLPDFASVDEQRDYLFEQYVERAWQRRTAEKKYTLNEIRHWSSRLAYGMKLRSQAMFFVEDLQPDWLPKKGRNQFYIRHRLLMMTIFGLTWLLSSMLFLESDEYVYYAVLGALWGWTLFFATERFGVARSLILFIVMTSIFRLTLDWNESLNDYFRKSLFKSTLPYSLILGVLSTLYHRTGQSFKRIHSVEALYFSIASTRWIGAVAGMAGGLLVTIPSFVSGNMVSPVEVIIKIIGTGFLAWIMTGFRSNQLQLSVGINEKIHRSLRNGLRMGLVGGIVAMFLVGIAFYPNGFNLADGAPALFNFLPLGMSAFFIYGGGVALQHFVLRRELMHKNIIPSDLVDLLQEGVQLGFIRRVGGGFIFIHRYLLEYFAGLHNTVDKDD